MIYSYLNLSSSFFLPLSLSIYLSFPSFFRISFFFPFMPSVPSSPFLLSNPFYVSVSSAPLTTICYSISFFGSRITPRGS
jgi:hypothetical protein